MSASVKTRRAKALGPHCPKCSARTFHDGKDFRCGTCGKRYGFRETGKVLGMPKRDFVPLDKQGNGGTLQA